MNQEHSATGQEISLAVFLNILWRRRLVVLGLPAFGLVVGVLYGVFAQRQWEATVTIRPGITAFDPDGKSHRQWRMRDITRWYEKRLFEPELQKRLALPSDMRVVIKTEFIPPSIQDYAGGDVITLWTMAASQDLAAAILDTSLALFSAFSEADSVGSQLKLTRDDLLLQIQRQKTFLQALDGETTLLNLRIETARAESLVAVSEDLQLTLDMEHLREQRAFYQRRLATLRQDEPILMTDFSQLDHALPRMAAEAGVGEMPPDLPSWVRRDAVLDRGAVLESLTSTKLKVKQALTLNRAEQDSMIYASEKSRIEHEKMDIYRRTNVRAKILDSTRMIGALIMERNFELPARQKEIITSIDEYLVRLGTIAPLQRVGSTIVSEKPVRPRPVRAILILVLGGGAAGVLFGLVWEYFYSHRRVIFRA